MDSTSISTLIGLVMPLCIDFVRTQLKVTNTKLIFWISIITSLAAGLATAFYTNQLTPGDIIKNLTIIFTASQVVYRQYWKDSKLREMAGFTAIGG